MTFPVGRYEEHVKLLGEKAKQPQEIPDDELSNLIRREVKRQVKELANRKRKTKKSRK